MHTDPSIIWYQYSTDLCPFTGVVDTETILDGPVGHLWFEIYAVSMVLVLARVWYIIWTCR